MTEWIKKKEEKKESKWIKKKENKKEWITKKDKKETKWITKKSKTNSARPQGGWKD